MFLLLSTTFLELAAFLIIICIILTNWNKMSKNYKLTAIISLLITGTFFINDLTIMASIKPTETTAQKIVISPKEQTLKNQLEIKLYPHGKFFLNETITVKPQNHLSTEDYQTIKHSYSIDPSVTAKLQILSNTDTPSALKYRANQYPKTVDLSQETKLNEKNIHLNNPKNIAFKDADITLTTVKVFKTTYTNQSQGFLHTNKKIKYDDYNLDLTFEATKKTETPAQDLESFFNN